MISYMPSKNTMVEAVFYCSYTCHEQCQDLVTLDCKTDLTPDSQTSDDDLYEDTEQGTLVRHEHLSNQNLSITVTSQEEEEEEEEETPEEDCQEEQEEKHEEEQQEKEQFLEEPFRKFEEVSTLRKSVNRLQSHLVDNETLEAWVEKYNASTQGLQIAKENDGSYRGCIRVHLNLSRPINIVAGTRPPSIYDILQEDRTMEKTLTSFYMPRDAVKAIHITSKTTTREVIIALLRKFKVVDNPQKFALYERTYDTGQPGKAKLRRLGDSECPLVLAINWSAQGLTNKRLVLQENDTADIQWEAFSLPELSNFLRILDREEEEYRCQIKDKYALLRRRIGNMLIQNFPSAE
ncbi:ras association domain-containing protein 1 homolog [Palaemon carinicauda]|uniref:ras association domain-containing protein 1 homolog n=1 Tax=Palaemon carinicauda TaxID=392227 RepID=UPI0035B5EBA3